MAAHTPHLDPTRARALFAAADGGTVLVVGDAMLDRYVIGAVDRISPEAPVPVLHVEAERTAPGGAANVAAGVAALGATCRLVAAVGADGSGAALRAGLAEAGVAADDLVVSPRRPTTEKTRVLARRQQLVRIDREEAGPLEPVAAEAVARAALAILAEADAVVLQDYDKGLLSPSLAERILAEARRRGIPAVVDPKLRHFFAFRGAAVIKPNARELAAALGTERAPEDEARLRRVLERLDAEHLLVTLGERGMLLVSAAEPGVCRIPARAREVYDVSGAGDTVVAALAVALLSRASMREAAELANVAAGLAVSRLGAVPIGRTELLNELARRP
ncbi:MAG: PfkB family carbohydrate kinase [Gemmatimonadota bacterium]|nr:PfkB family carbohydrate kinase [Gemmatimonadota bacterium]